MNVQQIKSFSVKNSSLYQLFSLNYKINELELLNDAPHYIGRGLTFELQDENGKLLCNSNCLSSESIYFKNLELY